MKRRGTLLVLAAVGVVAAARWTLAQPQADPLDPVRVAGDTHRLAF